MTLVEAGTADADIEKQVQLRQTSIDQKLREVYELQQEVAALNSTRNSKLTVSKLPVEIVVEILLYYRDDTFKSQSDGENIYKRANRKGMHKWWLTLIGICRHWRRIALQTPVLWSTLVSSICLEPHALEFFLAQSVDHTLDVSIVLQSWIDQGNNALVEIFRASKRVHSLSFELEDPDDEPQALNMQTSFSSLEYLEMDGTYGEDFAHELLNHILPTARNLRTLILRHLVVEWHHLRPYLFPTITSLSFTGAYTQPTDQQYSIWDVLVDLPGLESLSLVDGQRYNLLSEIPPVNKKITLTNLKYLEIVGQYGTVVPWLELISSRPAYQLKLLINPPRGQNVDEGWNILTDVFSYIPLPSETFIASLSFLFRKLVVRLSFDTLPHRPLFTITFHHFDSGPYPLGAFYKYLNQKAPNILSNVEEMTFGGPGRYGLTQVLQTQLGQHDDDVDVTPTPNQDAIVSPKLRCMRFEQIKFEEKSRDQLTKFLEKRDRLGHRIHALSFEKCSMEITNGSQRSEDFKNWIGDKADVLKFNGELI